MSSFIVRVLLIGIVLLGACRSRTGSEDYYVSEVRHHFRAAWSPDGARIAFTALINNIFGIYVVDTAGTNLRLVVAGDAIGAAWSPDTQWIAFSAGGILYKVNINTSRLDTISPTGSSTRPSWSKDGTRLAFVRSSSIYVKNLLTGIETDLQLRADFPSWHPNGRDIVVQEANIEAGVYRFTAVNDSTKAVRLLHFFSTADKCDFSSLSPNGNAIVYARKSERDYTQIWRVDLPTGQHTQLTNDSGDYPAWSPDGSKIVYTRTVIGDGGLWIMNADGTQKRRLTAPVSL
jgi:Tol biopolymer transport system component